MVQSAVHHGLCSRMTVFCQDVLFQTAGVNPDTNRHIVLFAALHYLTDTVLISDIARIDAHLINTRCNCFQSQTVVKMDICYNRN